MTKPILISKQIELDYGHTLPNHYSFCNQLHGHRGKVIATVKGNVSTTSGASDEGMVLDFKFLKELMMEKIHAPLDHGFAVWEKDNGIITINFEEETLEVTTLAFVNSRNKKVLITSEPPTAEYLAKWAYYQLLPHIPAHIELVKTEWYETPNSIATYER